MRKIDVKIIHPTSGQVLTAFVLGDLPMPPEGTVLDSCDGSVKVLQQKWFVDNQKRVTEIRISTEWTRT